MGITYRILFFILHLQAAFSMIFQVCPDPFYMGISYWYLKNNKKWTNQERNL
jgi:hypothetical protein